MDYPAVDNSGGLATGRRARPVAAGPVEFGAFVLRGAQRRLERDGAAVPLGDKAFEVLRILVANAGEVVGKADLLRQVGVVKEESLRFHIAALRRALGEGRYIANVAGQGYSFVAPVAHGADAGARPPVARPLPVPRPRRLIGRGEALSALAHQLMEHRFVTVVGPGGVGKTSLSLTLAHDLAAQFDGDVCFFDIGNVHNPDLLEGALAFALGVPVTPASAAPGVVPFLRARRILLVLDSCEPNVDAAAALAAQLYREAPGVHLLATSREALRAEGEFVHRLFPLSYPGADAGQTAQDALGFGAVQLFVERVTSHKQDFALTDDEAPLVSEICRKLDGLALAIELAAGRIGAFGVREVARQLENQFALMWPGRRTAVARHQTLSATLGWSHQLLSAREQVAFRRLSVFAGAFSLDLATAAIADDDISSAEAMELLGGLVSKSLLQFTVVGPSGAYHLLDTTRSYAADRLRDAGEGQAMAARHAQSIRRMLEDTSGARPEGDGPWRPRELLDDVSAALEWSLSPQGDAETAAALAAASASFWLEAGLLTECRYWMKRVLSAVESPKMDRARQLTIQAALVSAETFTDGFTAETYRVWQSTLAIAQSLGDVGQQMTCLVVLWAHQIRAPDFPSAFEFANQAVSLAAPLADRGARANADWMAGVTLHHLGRLSAARESFEHSLADDTQAAREAMMRQFGYDRRIASIGTLSNLHWLEGRPDEALRLGAAALSEARRLPYPVPLCEALTWQALNLHLRGDPPGPLDALLDETVAHTRTHFIESYLGLGLALKGLAAAARRDAAAPALVARGLELLAKANYEVFHPLVRTELARRRAEAGERLPSAEVEALLGLESGAPEQWCSAEVRRNLAEVLRRQGDMARAARLLDEAAACAARQGALGWALRVALSQAQASPDAVARNAARARLADLLGRFREGHETADLTAAARWLHAGA